jgi:hypothetical protein
MEWQCQPFSNMKINLPILFNQMDSRWANKPLGFNTDLTFNFYNYACLLCCHAAVSRYFGKNTNPDQLNSAYVALGEGVVYKAGGGEYVNGGLTKIYKDIKETVTMTPSLLTDAQVGEIKNSIDSGMPVVCQIDYNPQTVKADSHFVTLVDYNPNDENDFTIYDPLGGTIKSLKSYLGWFKPSMRNTIEQYKIYTGPKPIENDMMLVPKAIYPDLVHGSTEWDKTVAAYLPENTNPKATQFEDMQRVISGYKSTATTQENRANDLQKQLDLANTEILNQQDKLANITEDCQIQLKLKQTEITTLKNNAANIDKIKGQYEGTISDLQGKLRDAQIAGGKKDLQIADLQSQLNNCQKGIKVTQNYLVKLFKKLFNK